MTKKRIEFSLAEWEKQNRSVECLVCRSGEKPQDAHWFERRKNKLNMMIALGSQKITTTDNQGRYHGCDTESGYDLFIEIDVPDGIEERFVIVLKNGNVGHVTTSLDVAKKDLTNIESAKCYCKITTNLTTNLTTSEIVTL